ncbi:MAG TPA: RNA 2',3'-cyclic phosphodiesterase [Chloroflexota bacterium]
MRLFFAIELPAEVRSVLARLKPEEAGDDYRWVDPALLHVTLAFLGEQPADSLESLRRVGGEAVSHSRGGLLRLGKAGHFGSSRAPRVLWVDLVDDRQALGELQSRLDIALRDAGFALEDRPFRPHITLARRRQTARGGPPPGWPPIVGQAMFSLRHLSLMQSHLSSRGASYEAVFELPIGG